MRTSLTGPITLALLLACNASTGEMGELPKPFTNATAMRDCAPWDGAAVAVLLTTAPLDSAVAPTPPFVRLSIWKERAAVENGVFTWPESEPVGAASFCDAGDVCEAADSGTLRFHQSPGDARLIGDFQLIFKSRGKLAGRFRAPWLERTMLCG